MTRDAAHGPELHGAAATAKGDERPVLTWACDADEYTAGRVRIREQVLVDPTGQVHLATALLHRRITQER